VPASFSWTRLFRSNSKEWIIPALLIQPAFYQWTWLKKLEAVTNAGCSKLAVKAPRTWIRPGTGHL
jgi:hypothetical protein